jgi:hypothetical protein
MSNEHPDMSGNPVDAPFLCHYCGEPFREERAYGAADTDELFCSSDCVVSWEDSQIDQSRPEQ